jgi:ribosomal-protein-alanine N-acetyltransferase
MAPPTFTTARLRLRPIQRSDAKGLHAAYGDPEAMRFWDCAPSRDVAETAARIPRNTPHFGMWAVLSKDGRRFLGMVNFHARHAGHRRLAVGYILARPHWGQGIMSEAMAAFLDHCFSGLGSHRVEALIEPANAGSRRLAENLGFRREGLLRHRLFVTGVYRDVVMYGLLAEDWSARRKARMKAPRKRRS